MVLQTVQVYFIGLNFVRVSIGFLANCTYLITFTNDVLADMKTIEELICVYRKTKTRDSKLRETFFKVIRFHADVEQLGFSNLQSNRIFAFKFSKPFLMNFIEFAQVDSTMYPLTSSGHIWTLLDWFGGNLVLFTRNSCCMYSMGHTKFHTIF